MVSIPARALTLRYQGLFDMQGLYERIIGFFRSRQYDYIEKNWKEKDATPMGREVTIKMVPERKVSEYVKFEYKIEWKLVDLHDVDVVRDGHTITLQHCRFHFKVGATVNGDWQDLGSDAPKLSKFFEEKIINRELTKVHAANLQSEMQALLDLIKHELHMEVTRTQKEVAIHG